MTAEQFAELVRPAINRVQRGVRERALAAGSADLPRRYGLPHPGLVDELREVSSVALFVERAQSRDADFYFESIERRSGGRRAAQLHHPVLGAGHDEPAALPVARGQAGLGLEPGVEL